MYLRDQTRWCCCDESAVSTTYGSKLPAALSCVSNNEKFFVDESNHCNFNANCSLLILQKLEDEIACCAGATLVGGN